jgi:hypothetical protein
MVCFPVLFENGSLVIKVVIIIIGDVAYGFVVIVHAVFVVVCSQSHIPIVKGEVAIEFTDVVVNCSRSVG